MSESPAIMFYELLREKTPEGFVRWISLQPPWEHSEPLDCHCAEMQFGVSKDGCAIVWAFNTSWYLEATRRRMGDKPAHYLPDGIGYVSYHSSKGPQYEGQEDAGKCQWTGEDHCYSDGSYTQATELFELLLDDPTKLWTELESRVTKLCAQAQQQEKDERNFS